MIKHFTWVTGLQGPEGQIWGEDACDSQGKLKQHLVLHELRDDDNRTLDQLKHDYPYDVS